MNVHGAAWVVSGEEVEHLAADVAAMRDWTHWRQLFERRKENILLQYFFLVFSTVFYDSAFCWIRRQYIVQFHLMHEHL